jgi:hypothetical protein
MDEKGIFKTDKTAYNAKMAEFTSSIPKSLFVIEVSKFCGYSTFVLIYKNQTLLDLYKIISLHFECNNIKGLYLTKSTQHKIPLDDNVKIRDYIMNITHSNPEIIKPFYDFPLPVVYKIFIDDGHCCTEQFVSHL